MIVFIFSPFFVGLTQLVSAYFETVREYCFIFFGLMTSSRRQELIL
nr:MAG TPA: hypothetical protein [Caudoviricetes sp.]